LTSSDEQIVEVEQVLEPAIEFTNESTIEFVGDQLLDELTLAAVTVEEVEGLNQPVVRKRSKTLKPKRLTSQEWQEWGDDMAQVPMLRPQSRAECRDMPRPCPWVACRYHLYLDVNPRNGNVKFNFPDMEPWELTTSCALDIAEAEGGVTLEEIGQAMNLTRERVRQVEVVALELVSGEGTFKAEDSYAL